MDKVDIAIAGYLIAGFGMIFHIVGALIGVWSFEYYTWMIPVIGFILMTLAGGE